MEKEKIKLKEQTRNLTKVKINYKKERDEVLNNKNADEKEIR